MELYEIYYEAYYVQNDFLVSFIGNSWIELAHANVIDFNF